jgi:hypothetical protein
MGLCLEAPAEAIAECGLATDEIEGVMVLMAPRMSEQDGWGSRVAVYLGIEPASCDDGHGPRDRQSRPASVGYTNGPVPEAVAQMARIEGGGRGISPRCTER